MGPMAAIVDIYLPAPAPPPAAKKMLAPEPAKKAVKIGPKVLDGYAGDYRLGTGQVLNISRSGSDLVLSIPGQKFTLTPLSETEFLFDLAGATLMFQKDKEGKVRQLVFSQGGNDLPAPRIVLWKPGVEELTDYAGSYSNDELNLRFAVELRDGALVIKAPGQGDVRLAPDEKDKFLSTWRAMPKIVFQRDDQNRVTGFSIESAPLRDLVFRKDGQA